jgi:hypothetical protein
MGSTDGSSRNNKRPRGVAETFQVREHIIERQRDETSNVFANNPSGSCECNDAAHFRPEVAVVLFAFLLSGDAEGLTGEASADEIDSSKPTQSLCVKGVNVVEARNVGPVLAQNGSAVFISLAEGNGSHPGSLESETESANTTEEIEDIHAPVTATTTRCRDAMKAFAAVRSACTFCVASNADRLATRATHGRGTSR